MTTETLREPAEIDFIIFGAGNYNSLGVLHAMAEAGRECFLLIIGDSKDKKQGNIIGYSRFAKHIYHVSSADEGVEWLLTSQNNFPKRTVIYPTGDIEEKALDQNLNRLSARYIFPNAGIQGRVSELMDKQLQTALAEQSGIRILKSRFSNAPDFTYSKVEYPCMVKPLNSTSGSKGDMRVCETEQELDDALTHGRNTKDFIVQQYIRNEADLLFLGLALPNGDVIIPALVKKPGVSPTGEYTHAIITTDVDTHLPERKQVENFVKNIGYCGPFSIEFGLEKDKNYFFEINLRNDGTSHYPLNAGVNIPMIWYQAVRNQPFKSEFPSVEYEMIDEVADLRRVIGHELSLSSWLKSFLKAGTYRYYRKSDKKLRRVLISMFLNRTTDKVSRIFFQ